MRIDLLTSPGCPGCPAAREAILAFAAERPEVEVHEWDITRDPGPARGRGIFATPAVIVDGGRILLGVPTLTELTGGESRAQGERKVADTTVVDEVFEAVRKKYGFVPNLIREMSKSPAVARAYLGGQQALTEGKLTARDREAVQLAVSVYNECAYCRAAHRMGADATGIAPADVAATWEILDVRGWLKAADLDRFQALGIDRAQIYEIVALIGLKTISNYVNHIAHTEIDKELRG